MKNMRGSCFCGDVVFEVRGKISGLYQCHCSRCRKVTGSAANAAFVVAKTEFFWVASHGDIHSFVSPSGYRNDFCARCGSTVPNITRAGDQVWVPAGLMDDELQSQVEKHIYVASKASWDVIGGDAPKFDGAVPQK